MFSYSIVLGAGQGQRFGSPNKVFQDLNGLPVIFWSIKKAVSASDFTIVVLSEEFKGKFESEILALGADRVVLGGLTRSDSVRAGLEEIKEAHGEVIIHDGARPLASNKLFNAVLFALRGANARPGDLGVGAVVPIVKLTDTLKEVDNYTVIRTIPRETLYLAQTPQAFSLDVLKKAHHGRPQSTDDAELVERLGAKVMGIEGEDTNIKITYKKDIELARLLMKEGL